MEFAQWAKAAGIRAMKTFAQSALSILLLGEPTTGILDVSWLGVFSIASLAAVVSLLMSIRGLPEVTPAGQSKDGGKSDNNTLGRHKRV